MSWKKGDLITADRLNSENHVASWSFSQSDTDNDDDHYHTYCFYLHDGGGSNNPLIMHFHWNIDADRDYYWSDKKGPDVYFHWNKTDGNNGSNIGDDHNSISHTNTDSSGTLDIDLNTIKSAVGSKNIEGWYKYTANYTGSGTGDGTCDGYVCAYTCNNKAGYPIRRYKNPDEGGYYTDPQELSADNLNSHTFGTYKE